MDAPREDEVLVRVVGVGLCHTDLICRDQVYPVTFPAVFGHKGSGVVEKIGTSVTRLQPGDHVVLSFCSCGQCMPCKRGDPTHCAENFNLNFGGKRSDGSHTLHLHGQPIFGNFFGQSSFSTYALDNVLTDQGSETLLALRDHMYKAPTRDAHVLATYDLGTPVPVDSCMSSQADAFVGCYAIWNEEQDDPRNFAWLKETLPLMDPFAAGHYVNEVEGRTNPQRYVQCFSENNWKHLEQLRTRHDPEGVFHSYLGHS
ncbi:hypothetical protein ABO04_11560 [Nitrosomonas sp. HPC101]|nr:hypothetical protein [Nitrosomonas sp. HPC101]